eukprot:UN08711
MSMQQMREEYYKSQTLTKKFTDLLDDIRDILKTKQREVQSKFTKKKQTIVIPMAMPIKSTSINQAHSATKSQRKHHNLNYDNDDRNDENDSVESEC